MSVVTFTVGVTTRTTDPELLMQLAEEMRSRVESILGEEYGDPAGQSNRMPESWPFSASADLNWSGDVERYGYDGPTIINILTELKAVRSLEVED